MTTPARPAVTVVLPAHDEAGSIAQVVERLASVLAAEPHEIVVVDDGSRDDTWQRLQDLRARYPQLRGVRFTRNFGHQAAILAGLVASRGEAVVMMDADGQHPPELVPTLVARWRAGAMVVQGVRVDAAAGSALKRWTSHAFYRVFTILAGVRIPRGSADFRLLSRPVVDQVLASAGPLLFLRGLVPWLGFQTDFVTFPVGTRLAGHTSYTLRRMFRLSVDGLLSFSIVPLRIASFVGVGVSLLSFAYLAYVVAIWMTPGAHAVAGWASTAGLLSLLGGLQLMTLGILGEYLGRLFLSGLHRPAYVVREQIESQARGVTSP